MQWYQVYWLKVTGGWDYVLTRAKTKEAAIAKVKEALKLSKADAWLTQRDTLKYLKVNGTII